MKQGQQSIVHLYLNISSFKHHLRRREVLFHRRTTAIIRFLVTDTGEHAPVFLQSLVSDSELEYWCFHPWRFDCLAYSSSTVCPNGTSPCSGCPEACRPLFDSFFKQKWTHGKLSKSGISSSHSYQQQSSVLFPIYTGLSRFFPIYRIATEKSQHQTLSHSSQINEKYTRMNKPEHPLMWGCQVLWKKQV